MNDARFAWEVGRGCSL